jgi:hypothetical protein
MTSAANLAAVGSYAVSTGLPFSGASTITSGTAVTATTQTSIQFTGIPSWVKRITVMINGLSTNSSSNILFQLGTGSTTYTTSGYLGASSYMSSGVATTAFTTGFGLANATGSTAFVVQGNIVITNVSGNIWTASGVFGESDVARTLTTGGGVTLGAVLTAVRLYIDGTQQFDAGTINILYE